MHKATWGVSSFNLHLGSSMDAWLAGWLGCHMQPDALCYQFFLTCKHSPHMQPPLPIIVLQAMDKVYGLSKVQNSEIKFRYKLIYTLAWTHVTLLAVK